MLDNGFPLAMEMNVLKELIKPPNFLRTITDTVTGKSTRYSSGRRDMNSMVLTFWSAC